MGIHRRGAHLATRLHRLVCDLLDAEVPLGDIDIAFYRDDLATRASRPGRPRLAPAASGSRTTPSSWSTTCSTPGRTVRAGDRGAVRLRAPRARAARRARRPRPPRAPDPPRLRRQEPARPPAPSASTSASREIDGADEVTITSSQEALAHEAPAVHRGPRPRRHRAHPRPREVVHRGLRARDQEGPRAARPARAEPLLRGLHAHALAPSSWPPSRSAPTSSTSSSSGSSVEKGESLKDTVQTLSAYRPGPDRHPHAARRRRRAGRGLDDRRASSTPATASTSTRRRRCSTSTRCASGSARSTAANIWIVGDVLHSRVARSNILAFTEDGREGHGLRPADADPARDRGARLRGRLHARPASPRPTSSTRCGCSTSA